LIRRKEKEMDLINFMKKQQEHMQITNLEEKPSKGSKKGFMLLRLTPI